jgi:HD-like signal output (HDOD) protein
MGHFKFSARRSKQIAMNTSVNPRDIEYLRTLSVFDGSAAWQLQAVVGAVEDVDARKGQTLLSSGSDDGYTYFLTEGRVRFESAEGERREVDIVPAISRSPVSNLRPRLFSVKTLSRVHGFRIPDMVVSAAAPPPPPASGEDEGDTQTTERLRLESELGFRIYRDLCDEAAVLPSLPDLALRIRQAIENGASDARDIARVVETDPAMTAKLIKVANSAFYSRRNPVETCTAAVVRLGTRTTQKLVLTFSMREVFQAPQSQLKERMRTLWSHSADVAAISFTLARHTGRFDPEEALLAGLLHDVGTIAILNYSRNMPLLSRDPEALEGTIRRLRGELGAMILRAWSFPADLVAAVREAENWLRPNAASADLADLVIAAQAHERLAHRGLAELPPFDEITAIQRVLGKDITPETSLEIIKTAQSQITEMRGVLGG